MTYPHIFVVVDWIAHNNKTNSHSCPVLTASYSYIRLHFATVAMLPNADQGLLIHEDIRPHNDAPELVGHLWKSDQTVAETSTWQNTLHTRDKRPRCGGIRTENPSKRAVADPQLRSRGHCDRRRLHLVLLKEKCDIEWINFSVVWKVETLQTLTTQSSTKRITYLIHGAESLLRS